MSKFDATKLQKLFYGVCWISGSIFLIWCFFGHHYSFEKFWQALSITGLIIGSYLWIRRDLWVTREERKNAKCADQWGACLVAFVWLILIVPLALALTLKSGRLLFLSTLFLFIPISNRGVRWLEKQKFF